MLMGIPAGGASGGADAARARMMKAWSDSFPGLNPYDLFAPATETAKFVHRHLFKTHGSSDVAHPGWRVVAEAYRDILVTGFCVAYPQCPRPAKANIHDYCDEIHGVLTAAGSHDAAVEFAEALQEADPLRAGGLAQNFPHMMCAVGRQPLPAQSPECRMLSQNLYLRLVTHGCLGALMANGRT